MLVVCNLEVTILHNLAIEVIHIIVLLQWCIHNLAIEVIYNVIVY